MKLSQGFWQTYKEAPNDAEIMSHKLMIRAGLIQKAQAGIYYYLPVGFKAIKKVEEIIRSEMNKAGCFELAMPVVTPGELWEESGRIDKMGTEMLKAQDRGGRTLCISPTNEEAIVDVFRKNVKSYKQLPLVLYQINTKFRDEIRPRYGVMRGREFTMKDAYSFHTDWESLNKTYDKMFKAYENIFKRIGLKFIAVDADGGSMADGKAKTHEFQVLAPSGEDKVIFEEKSGYAANIEKAVTTRGGLDFIDPSVTEKVETKGITTISKVATALEVKEYQCLKAVVYSAVNGEKEEAVISFVLGDDSINEIKLNGVIGADHINSLEDHQMGKFDLVKGFIGPSKNLNVRMIFDSSIDLSKAYVVGANETDFHLKGFVPNNELDNIERADLRLSKEGDFYEGNPVKEISGIEVGHIFQLGDKYTKSMKVVVSDQNGKMVAPVMGCYGAGITRIVAASIEQCADEKGIVWPKAIAPYDLTLVLIGKDEDFVKRAHDVYQELLDAGIEVMFDDRKAGPGFKFKDADLLGLPLQVVLGQRDFDESGEYKINTRVSGESITVAPDKLVETVKLLLESL